MRVLGDEIASIEGALAGYERELDEILLQLPNIPLAEVPEGGEENNRIVREWGEPRASDGARPHWEIGEQLGILDLAAGAKVSGSGFIVLPAGRRATRARAHVVHARSAHARARIRGSVGAIPRHTRDDDGHRTAAEVRGRGVSHRWTISFSFRPPRCR